MALPSPQSLVMFSVVNPSVHKVQSVVVETYSYLYPWKFDAQMASEAMVNSSMLFAVSYSSPIVHE